MDPNYGDFKLDSVAGLPNVSVAFPGEHWSDGKASELIVPGELIVPIASGGKKYWEIAASGALDPRACIALRTVQIPDTNRGSVYSEAIGPNEIMNTAIQPHEWVHAYRSGAFHLTLIKPDAGYAPSQLLTWDPTAARPTGKGGTGAWTRTGATSSNAFFEVEEFRPLPGTPGEGILTVKSLRSQF